MAGGGRYLRAGKLPEPGFNGGSESSHTWGAYRAGGDGGVIAIDPQGNVALVFNTEGMYRASINNKGQKVIGIFGEPYNTVKHGQDLSDG